MLYVFTRAYSAWGVGGEMADDSREDWERWRKAGCGVSVDD